MVWQLSIFCSQRSEFLQMISKKIFEALFLANLNLFLYDHLCLFKKKKKKKINDWKKLRLLTLSGIFEDFFFLLSIDVTTRDEEYQ